MAYIWVNPVTESMYEPKALTEFLQKYGYKQVWVRKDWLNKMYRYYDFSTKVTSADKSGLQKTADFMYENGMIEKKLNVDILF